MSRDRPNESILNSARRELAKLYAAFFAGAPVFNQMILAEKMLVRILTKPPNPPEPQHKEAA